MLIGFLLPLLRRFGTRTRLLIALAVTAGGLALILTVMLRGHVPSGAPLIRWGLLLTLIGLALLISGVRGTLRDRRSPDDVDRPSGRP